MTEQNDQELIKMEENEEKPKETPEVVIDSNEHPAPLNPDLQKTLYLSNILHPGGWRMHPDIINFLSNSVSFQIGFNSQPGKEKKTGYIKLTFARPYDAREAYLQALKVRIGGDKIKVTVENGFCDPADPSPCPWFEIPEDEDLKSRTLYALDLLKSTKAHDLKEIFEPESIESISFFQLNKMQKQAEVRLVSAEAASTALQTLADWELDDGNSFSMMRLLNPPDYKKYSEECRIPQPFLPPPDEPEEIMEDGEIKSNKRKHEEEAQVPVEEAPQLAPEVYEDDLIIQFDKYINENRINWAEIDEVDELFTICDHVSRCFNGLPDSVLKPAMLSTLNRQLAIVAGSGYLTQHVNDLIEKWKREMTRSEPKARDGQVVMEAPTYEPQPLPKRRRDRNTRAGTIKMSVGALLKSVRDSIKTEEGELDFAEDEFGNYTISGEELSFESYARLTKTTEPEVKSMFPSPLTNAMKMAQIPKKIRKEWYEKRMAKKKLHLMQKEQENMRKLEENASQDNLPPKPPKELDEGEIDSEEEKRALKSQGKKKKKRSSSSSSSSSDSDGNDSAVDARGRRRERRKKERRTGANAMDHRRAMQLYHNRMAVCSLLSSEQKMLLVNVLKEESIASR
ncbi:unnamed protein product [Auanema sp. JU1783]|nr:unnamed protein product [Auanema sp. JU1783]